ncbi:hypothetical protein HYS28_02620 [Candidatus Uhrbacteria bacterium]|nr:hypothetical protein [Candidatus Uhrbacteria bacterium]MBI4598936.1 hypothetical protein [Candidatus Uhrbacteria bacterium]
MKPRAARAAFFLLLLVIAAWGIVLFGMGPSAIIERIGISQGYLLAFVAAAIGGFSSLTAAPFFALIAGLSAAGLHPLLLGVAGGAGLTIGDSLFFWLGKTGRTALPTKTKRRQERWAAWLAKRPAWLIPLIVLVYASVVPLPNDILTVSLGLAGYQYRLMIVPLLLGDIAFTTLVAFTGAEAWEAIATSLA